jgi:hypothetical protein
MEAERSGLATSSPCTHSRPFRNLNCTNRPRISSRSRNYCLHTMLVLRQPAQSPSNPGKLADRVSLRKGNSKVTGMYSALDIIRLVFSEDSGYDVTEFEDLLEQQQQASSHSRSIINSYLQVPGQGLEQDNATWPRPASHSSQDSQTSVASWRRQTEQDVVVPLQSSSIRETKQTARPVVESVPLTPQKQKKYSRLGN